MRAEEKLPENLQAALRKGLLKRLPLTFLPFVHQQLNQWDHLFPNERQSIERLLLYVADLSGEESARLFREVVEVEEKMGVRTWQFSTSEQTILNSSELARSPYFQQWRQAVQAVFDAADKHASNSGGAAVKAANRLVLTGIPQALSLDPGRVWRRWQGIGRTVKLDLGAIGKDCSALQRLLTGLPNPAGGQAGGLLEIACNRPGASAADTWVVDAGRSLVDGLLALNPSHSAPEKTILLSDGRLDLYRQNFSRAMNTMQKDLADADAVYDGLRKVEVTRWCPPEVASDTAVREFLRALYLTGNGAVIYGNSFVEWAASEALRRARPSFLAAQFGIRSKPKPFTGVAVFDNPDQVNPLPAVDDLPGSALDAQMLALYVWLASQRYPEYAHGTVGVCVAESLSQAYIVAPPEFALDKLTEPVSLERLGELLGAWMG